MLNEVIYNTLSFPRINYLSWGLWTTDNSRSHDQWILFPCLKLISCIMLNTSLICACFSNCKTGITVYTSVCNLIKKEVVKINYHLKCFSTMR